MHGKSRGNTCNIRQGYNDWNLIILASGGCTNPYDSILLWCHDTVCVDRCNITWVSTLEIKDRPANAAGRIRIGIQIQSFRQTVQYVGLWFLNLYAVWYGALPVDSQRQNIGLDDGAIPDVVCINVCRSALISGQDSGMIDRDNLWCAACIIYRGDRIAYRLSAVVFNYLNIGIFIMNVIGTHIVKYGIFFQSIIVGVAF